MTLGLISKILGRVDPSDPDPVTPQIERLATTTLISLFGWLYGI